MTYRSNNGTRIKNQIFYKSTRPLRVGHFVIIFQAFKFLTNHKASRHFTCWRSSACCFFKEPSNHRNISNRWQIRSLVTLALSLERFPKPIRTRVGAGSGLEAFYARALQLDWLKLFASTCVFLLAQEFY